jgi:thioredoxin 1
MSNLKKFEEASFDQEVLQAEGPVLVDFYADWCGPCKMMSPVIHEIAATYVDRIKVGELDVDANGDIAVRYGVMGIPTLGVFEGGKLVDRLVGYPGPNGVKDFVERNAKPAGVAQNQ